MNVNNNQNGGEMTLSKILNWLLNQSLPIVILIVMISWQTKQNTLLEAKIEKCNSDRIAMYETQMKIIIEAVQNNRVSMENNSKALENHSRTLDTFSAKRR